MPLKICPQCSKGVGPRKLTCVCGHQFSPGKSKKQEKTLSGNHPKLPPGKLTVGEVQQYLAYEGIDALFIIRPERIDDRELSTLWDKARKAVSAAKKKAYSIDRGEDNIYGPYINKGA